MNPYFLENEMRSKLEYLDTLGEKKEYCRLLMSFYHSGVSWQVELAQISILEKLDRYIHYYINRYFPGYDECYREDMCQEAGFGILKGMRHFDPEISPTGSLTTYFRIWIHHGLCSFVSREIYHVSPDVGAKMRKVKKTLEKYKSDGYDDPSDLDVAEATGLTVKTVKAVRALLAVRSRREEFLPGKAALQPDSEPGPEKIFLQTEIEEKIWKYLKSIGESEYQLINLLFGMDGQPIEKRRRVASQMGLSVYKMNKRRKEILEKLSKIKELRDICD